MSDFTARIKAELDTSKLEQQLKQIENKNHKIKVDVDAGNSQKNVNNVNNSIKNAQQSASSFGTTLKKSLNIGTAAAITAQGFRMIRSAANDAVEAVKDFDDAILNLRMATNGSYESTKSLVQSYNQMGKALGATTSEVSNAADSWLRQGHNIKDTNTLIKDSMTLSKVANLDAADSTEYLTSAMKGYKVAVEDVSKIVDKLTAVDLVSATDAGGLAEAMSRTAVTADMAGVSMDKLLGYLATVGEVTQKSMSSIGESFKTIFARMSDIKSNKLELVDEDGTTQLLSDVELTLKNVGIDLRSTVTEFDNYGEVLDNLASKWDSLGGVQQAALAKAFAGVRQQENFRVLMENYDSAKKYMDVAAESAGTAEEKFGAYLDSIEAKTKSLQATFESLATNTFSSELAGELIDASAAVLKFLDETNLLKGTLAGLAVAGAIKGFTTLATGISNAAIKMNQFNASLQLVKAGNIGEAQIQKLALMTSNLSESQLKAVLASKALSTEQRIAVLTAQGMTTAEAEAALASMGLATAEGAATATTFSLSGALKGLWATLMANPFILIVAAVTAAVSIFTSYQQKVQEARDATLEAGEAAKDEANNIKDLFRAYNTANEAYKSNQGSKEELQSATESLLEALGVEQSKLDELIEKYGGLDEAIQKVTIDSLKDKLSDLTSGYKAAQEELLKATKDGWFDSFSLVEFSHNKNTIKFADTLKDAGLIDSGSYGSAGGGIYIGENETIEGVMEIYDNLQKMKKALEDKIGESYTREELAESDLYNSLNEKVNSFKEEYDNVLDYVEQMNALSAEIAYNEYVNKNGIPESRKEFDKLKKSITDSAKTSGEFVGSQKQIEDAVTDTLAKIPELKDFYNQVEEKATTTSEVVTKSADDLTQSVEAAKSFVDGIKNVQNILNEQKTGTSIAPDVYNSAELADYTSALEYHNGVLQLNAEKVREIIKAKSEEEIAINNTKKAQAQQSYLENAAQIEKLRAKIREKNFAEGESAKSIQDNIDSILAENSALKTNCDTYDLMTNSIQEATSAYQNWLNAQNASQSGEMFDGALEALKKIDDTLNNAESDSYGRIGNADFKAAIDFVIPDNIDSSDEKAVNDYLDSIADVFTFDKDKNRTGLDIEGFCERAVKAGLMVLDDSNDEYKIAGQKTMEDFAEGLGLSLPLVQAMFGEMEEFGGEFSWADEADKTIGDLAVTATESAEALRKIGDNSDLIIKLDVTDIEDSQTAIDTLQDTIDEMDEVKAKPGVDSSEIEHANNIIRYCVEQQQLLSTPAIMDVDTSLVDGKIGDAIQLLQQFHTAANNLEMNQKLGLDTTDAQAQVDELTKKIQNSDNAKIMASLSVDTTSVDSIKESLQNDTTCEMIVKAGVDDKAIVGYTADDKTAKVVYSVDHSAVDMYNPQNLERSVTYRVKTVGSVDVNGSAHAGGSARAGGDWRDKTGGTTLVGELGQEIVVDPRTGRWYTVGDTGAEFVDIPKGSIVFNHLQSKSLLENGYVDSRAKAFASGSAMVTGGIKKKQTTKPAETQNKKTESEKKKDSTKTKTKSEDKTDKVLEKFKDWFSSLFDWIEIKLERQTKKIDRFVKKADIASDSGSYKTAALNYRKAINATSTQISYEQTAKSKYASQANSVLNKAVSMGVVSKQQADTIAKKVKNGSMNISEYSDRIQEVIKDYQTWYDKSQDAADAITDLHNSIRTYIKDLKDMRDAQRDAKLSSIDTYTSIATSGVANTAETKNSQLSYTNSQLKSQNSAYDKEVTEVSKDTTSVGKSGTTAIRKVLKSKEAKGSSKKAKAYKKALNNAKKAIKAKKPVSSMDLKTIKSHSISVYNKLYAYNLALDNLETAKLEQATNYAATSSDIYQNIAEIYNMKDAETNSKISLLSQKADNAYSTKQINSYLNQQSAQYDTILKNDDKEIERYSNDVSSNKKTIKNKAGTTKRYKSLDSKTKKAVKKQVDAAKAAAKSGKTIGASTIAALAKYYSKGYVTQAFYQACVNYNNALDSKEQAQSQKEIDQQTAIQEKARIAAEKMANIADKYNEKDDRSNSKISLYTSKANNATSAKSANSYLAKAAKQYDTIVANDEKEIAEYSKAVKANAKTIKNKAGTTSKYKKLSAAKRKTIQGYIDKAKAAAKSGKSISDSIMDKLQSYYTKGYITAAFYDACVNYNAAIDSKKEAEAQKEIDEQTAIAEKAAIGTEMVNNVEQEYTNKLNDNANKTRSIQTAQAIRTTRGLSLTSQDYKNLIAQSQADQSLYSQAASAISSQIQANLAAGYWTTDSQEYKDAIQTMNDYSSKAEECKIEQEQWNNAIAELPYNAIEKALELLDAIKSNYESLLSINLAKGISKTQNEYLTQIANINSEIARYTEERAQAWKDYQTALASADGVYGGKTADEWLTQYYSIDTTINGLTADIVDLNNAIAQLPYDTIQKALDLLDSVSAYDDSVNKLKQALGMDLSENDYLNQIANNNDQISQYEKERSQAFSDYLKAVADSNKVYGGKTADEWLTEYNQYGTEINNIKVENEALKDSLRDDVYWRAFEKAHKEAQEFANVLSGISDLIDSDMYFDKDGNMTQYGVAQIATLVSEYETARKEVQNYQNDIENLNSLFAQGYYTQDEYTDKMNELQVALLNSASSMKSFSDSIVDMYKETAKAELDSLMDLIDARNDALSAKKSYYDYDRTIKDRTKDIQTLEAEIAALEGVETAQAKAKRATYEAQLAEAKQDLDDTINEHIFELSQDALSELKNTLQDAFDDKWDNISANLDEISSLMAAANSITSTAAGTITNTLNQLLQHYGINPVSSGISAAYAKGTKYVPHDMTALTNENGNEIIVTKQGMITPLEQGDGVLPSYLTQRLYNMAENGEMLLPQPRIADIKVNVPTSDSDNVNNPVYNIDMPVTIEGNADKETIRALKDAVQKEFLQKSYEYTSDKIYKGYLKSGGKRQM